MAWIGASTILSLLKNKLFLVFLGSSAVGGIVTSIALKLQSASNDEVSKFQNSQSDYFFTEEKLKNLINRYEIKEKLPHIPEVEDRRKLPGDKEISNFLTVSHELERSDTNVHRKKAIRLTKEQREALSVFCQLYAGVESESKLSTYQGDNIGLVGNHKVFQSSIVCDDLYNSFKWDEENGTPVKKGSSSENGGGGNGSTENPYRHFYTDNGVSGAEKMNRLGSERSKYNSDALKELEYDISSGIIKEMRRIHETYLKEISSPN